MGKKAGVFGLTGPICQMAVSALAASLLLTLAAAPAEARGGAGEDQKLTIFLGGRPFSLAARVFRPMRGGPSPLVVINHGLPISMDHARSAEFAFTRAARWFAAQGYIVVEALRPGFGGSDGPFQEQPGPCDDRDYVHEGRATAMIERAIVESAAKLPGVDARQIIIVGHSAGGFGATALADAPPKGVIGVISLAGGRGADGDGGICSGPQRLVDAAATFGRGNKVPQLWLSAANDRFFAPSLEYAMATAYRAGSKPPVRYVELPPSGTDGHLAFIQADPSFWTPAVSAFLRLVTHPSHANRP